MKNCYKNDRVARIKYKEASFSNTIISVLVCVSTALFWTQTLRNGASIHDSFPLLAIVLLALVLGLYNGICALLFRFRSTKIIKNGIAYQGTIVSVKESHRLPGDDMPTTYHLLIEYPNNLCNGKKRFWTPAIRTLPKNVIRMKCSVFELADQQHAYCYIE